MQAPTRFCFQILKGKEKTPVLIMCANTKEDADRYRFTIIIEFFSILTLFFSWMESIKMMTTGGNEGKKTELEEEEEEEEEEGEWVIG